MSRQDSPLHGSGTPRPRKGASSRAAIPAEVLRRLNRGEEASITLVEWLAVDQAELCRHVLPGVGLGEHAPAIVAQADAVSGLGVMERHRRIAGAIWAALPRGRTGRDEAAFARSAAWRALAEHPSDTVRCWAALGPAHAQGLTLDRRLALARRFAADGHMGVREMAWMSLRGAIIADLPRALDLLKPWTLDADANIRRCAIEATRPRGVWCQHIEALKRDPSPGLPLLENVRADPSKYVRLSAGNWLNDAGKSQAGATVVRTVCARWTQQSPCPETVEIVARGLRTLQKARKDGRLTAPRPTPAAAPPRTPR